MESTELKDLNLAAFNAKAALILYGLQDNDKGEDGDFRETYYGNNLPKSFVTLHSIRNGELCEGAPLTRRKLLKFCKSILPSSSKDIAFLPEKIIAYNSFPTTMLWWLPSGVKHLFFDKSTGIPCGKAPLPPLLFRFSGIGLTVFALKENKRPTLDTKIYQSPFWNWGCMGDVKLPERPIPADVPTLESLFFRSAFTFHNPPKLRGTTGDALWKSLVKSGKTEFPYECLVPAGPVGDLFKRMANDYD